MELNTENVLILMRECLPKDEEMGGKPSSEWDEYDHLYYVQGVAHNYAFVKERLDARKDDIHSMLSQLPVGFRVGQGDGLSFLAGNERQDGTIWSGFHIDMEALFCLGMPHNFVKFSVPQELWHVLPFGAPYITLYLD